jgi:hypothetical protein
MIFRMVTMNLILNNRLPDSNFIPQEYNNYGRFAILNDNSLWFGGVKSSHPSNTKIGFYWATKGDNLLISPRGCNFNWKCELNTNVLLWLCKKLNLRSKFNVIDF